MNGSEILKQIIGDNCVAENITADDVRKQADAWNKQELIETGEIAFTDEDIEDAIRAM